jgi:RNase H-like domain found in reverse transcriptase/Reverse transcriptase (RNA-dependent DNA polymerase)/Integrase zinc binding domain/Chromo (CHRromatin Organisation MOdifier) domain
VLGNQKALTVEVQWTDSRGKEYRAIALVDSGSTINIVNPSFVNKTRMPWVKKKIPYRMRTYEGQTASYDGGMSSRETTLLITVDDDPQEVDFDILPTGPKCDMILGHPWLKKYNPDIDWKNGHLNSRLDATRAKTAELDRASRCPEGQESPCEHNRHTSHDEPMSTDRRDTKDGSSHTEEPEGWVMYVRPEKPEDDPNDDSGYETSEEGEDLSRVPREYRTFTVFRHKMKNELPQRTAFDHEIKLKEGAKLRYHKAYHLGPRQDKALREYIDENLPKGFIRESMSEAAYPILFVPKKGTTDLRLVVDYRQLNEETIKNRYPLPLIREMKDRLAGAQWFSRLDLPMAFGHIRIKEGDEWKTAFRTRYGHFEYQVMPMGLTNAPATFQSMIDHTLRPYLDRFAFVYLDDILIYSKTLEEHRQHVRQVLQKLQDAGLSVNQKKSEFHVQKTIFLGFEITPGEIRMEPTKISAVRDWPTPRNQKEVRMFIGYINFYRSFIKGFGKIAKPLHELTGEGTTFEWRQEQQNAFDELKDIIGKEPVLRMPDFSRKFYVETDASDFAVGAELYQIFDDGRHPVGFVSKKISGPALNYPIHDKELMAIIEAFNEWRPYLSGTEEPVDVFTDHRNLKYFVTKELSPRQIRWAEFLAPFNFRIHYVKGKENARADALSRRPDHKGNEKYDAAPMFKERNGTLEHGIQIWEDCVRTYHAEWEEYEFQAKRRDVDEDEIQDLELRVGPEDDAPVWYDNKAYVSMNKRHGCVTKLHEDRLGGHPGIKKTLERVQQHYAFPRMKKVVEEVVKECETCIKSKAARHKPYGLLEPLPTPERAWGSISMDFITKLPSSTVPDGTDVKYDSIWVVVDRLTKWAYFIPFRETTTAEQLAYHFERNIVSQHGLPDDITTDRDKLFTSKFWQALMKRLDIKSKLSTAFHPQTDGQTERLNQVIEQYLRCYINFEQDNWVDLLPTAQLAYNSSKTETTHIPPFFANYGYDPELRQGPAADVPRAAIRAGRLQEMHDMLKETLEFVRDRMRVHYDKHRVEGPPLEEGDKVFLLTRNLHTKRPSRKLDFKKIGPFKIKKKISTSNYELDLPDSMRVRTKVFHISLLEPAPRKARLETQLEVVDDEEEFDVEDILDSRISNNKLQYLVKWLDYGPESNSWEPADFLDCPEKLQQFHRRNPDRPGPTSLGPASPNPYSTTQGYQRPQRTTGDNRPLRLGTPLPD